MEETKRNLWLLTFPAFLLVTAILVWIVSPVKGLITGNKLIDMEGTWFDVWIGKIF